MNANSNSNANSPAGSPNGGSAGFYTPAASQTSAWLQGIYDRIGTAECLKCGHRGQRRENGMGEYYVVGCSSSCDGGRPF